MNCTFHRRGAHGAARYAAARAGSQTTLDGHSGRLAVSLAPGFRHPQEQLGAIATGYWSRGVGGVSIRGSATPATAAQASVLMKQTAIITFGVTGMRKPRSLITGGSTLRRQSTATRRSCGT